MLNFVLQTISVAVGILVASTVSVIAMMKIMTNPKAMKWFTVHYIKTIEKACKSLETIDLD